MRNINKILVIGLVLCMTLSMGCIEGNENLTEHNTLLSEYNKYMVEHNRLVSACNDLAQDDRISGKEKIECYEENIRHSQRFVNFINENKHSLRNSGIDIFMTIDSLEKGIEVLEHNIDINDGNTIRIEYRDGGFERFHNVVDITLLKQGTFSHTYEIIFYDGNAKTLHYVVDCEMV